MFIAWAEGSYHHGHSSISKLQSRHRSVISERIPFSVRNRAHGMLPSQGAVYRKQRVSVGLRQSERRESHSIFGLRRVFASPCGHGCNRASMRRWSAVPALLPLLSQLFHDVLLACACALAAAAQPLNVAVELPNAALFRGPWFHAFDGLLTHLSSELTATRSPRSKRRPHCKSAFSNGLLRAFASRNVV